MTEEENKQFFKAETAEQNTPDINIFCIVKLLQ